MSSAPRKPAPRLPKPAARYRKGKAPKGFDAAAAESDSDYDEVEEQQEEQDEGDVLIRDVGEEDEGEEKKGVPAPKYKYIVDSCSSSWMTDTFLRPRTLPCVACANAGLECEYCPPLSFHKAEVWCCRWCRECSWRKCSLWGLGGPPGAKKDFPEWFAEWEVRKG